jgi:putative DNA methylase
MVDQHRKKLIEVALPLEAINAAASREKSIRHGHPSTLHLYWARRPLATARAVLFAQLVDDPASRPEEFPTVEEQDTERARLHKLIEDLVKWENSNNEQLLEQARIEIRKSNGGQLPPVLDPFAGGGSIPLEAQRLGLEAHASDLNPLAVLINKALIEIPPKFAGQPPVFPGAKSDQTSWSKAQGLAEDVRRYGRWMRDEAEKQIGNHYPKVVAPGGTEQTVIAWIWARTVKSPNPANPIETPLVRSWWLSKKKGKEAYIVPEVIDGRVEFSVSHDANGPAESADGTVGRTGAKALGDDSPISLVEIREQATKKGFGSRLLAIVADAEPGRLYVDPSAAHERFALIEETELDAPEALLPEKALGFRVFAYGFRKWSDLFSPRQLLTMTTFSKLVGEVREQVRRDAVDAGLKEGLELGLGGQGAVAYADAVATYLALAVSRLADYSSSICTWNSARDGMRNVFARQAIPMAWDYAEANPFSSSTGSFLGQVDWVSRAVDHAPSAPSGHAAQKPAQSRDYRDVVVSTDPPYYDNIGYSDLSDFFYVWLRPMLRSVFPDLVSTMLTPKAEELVANPFRLGGKEKAETFFVDGFNSVFREIRSSANQSVPLTVYYAYKQQEASSDGTSSTGWHTLLGGLISSGWEITATWPMSTERVGRQLAVGTNALASSIVLACRPRQDTAEAITRKAFVQELKAELPLALRTLMQGDLAPVDLAQAAIGPGISVFSRYSRVRDADGSDMTVKDALQIINSTLDEVLGEQESDFDSDTRFAVRWYRQFGWGTENSGTADQLARATGTSLAELERGSIFEAKGGKSRLIAPSALAGDWDPAKDVRVSQWEATVRLAAIMAKDGADRVAQMLPDIQTRLSLDAVKELGFLLFHEAEKKGDTKDAGLFNGLVGSWGDVNSEAKKLATRTRAAQQAFDFEEGDE